MKKLFILISTFLVFNNCFAQPLTITVNPSNPVSTDTVTIYVRKAIYNVSGILSSTSTKQVVKASTNEYRAEKYTCLGNIIMPVFLDSVITIDTFIIAPTLATGLNTVVFYESVAMAPCAGLLTAWDTLTINVTSSPLSIKNDFRNNEIYITSKNDGVYNAIIPDEMLKKDNVELLVYDLSGRIVKTFVLNQSTTNIDLANLNSSIYVAEFRQQKSTIATQKIIAGN